MEKGVPNEYFLHGRKNQLVCAPCLRHYVADTGKTHNEIFANHQECLNKVGRMKMTFCKVHQELYWIELQTDNDTTSGTPLIRRHE